MHGHSCTACTTRRHGHYLERATWTTWTTRRRGQVQLSVLSTAQYTSIMNHQLVQSSTLHSTMSRVLAETAANSYFLPFFFFSSTVVPLFSLCDHTGSCTNLDPTKNQLHFCRKQTHTQMSCLTFLQK